MRKAIKIVFVLIVLLSSGGAITYFVMDEPLPEGNQGQKADELAHLMLDAVNKEAYDTLDFITWTYPAGHTLYWNKSDDSVRVDWEDMSVTFCTKTLDGYGLDNGKALTGEKLKKGLSEAWSIFANDSFWLVAPFKVFDPGTVRKTVEWEGQTCLLVTYTSGGVTPGDSYLWILDEQFKPKAWKFWTQKIPIGGMKFTWEGWTEHQGAWFSTLHLGPKTLQLTGLSVR